MTRGSSISADEKAIRVAIDAITKAVRENDVDAMLAQCTPDIVTFDMLPPRRHEGATAIRRNWAQAPASFDGPVDYEVRQLKIRAGGDGAFCRGLNRFGGTRAGGERIVNWLCSTLGFREMDGRWKVARQHVSAPFDMETGKVMLHLQP